MFQITRVSEIHKQVKIGWEANLTRYKCIRWWWTQPRRNSVGRLGIDTKWWVTVNFFVVWNKYYLHLTNMFFLQDEKRVLLIISVNQDVNYVSEL